MKATFEMQIYFQVISPLENCQEHPNVYSNFCEQFSSIAQYKNHWKYNPWNETIENKAIMKKRKLQKKNEIKTLKKIKTYINISVNFKRLFNFLGKQIFGLVVIDACTDILVLVLLLPHLKCYINCNEFKFHVSP